MEPISIPDSEMVRAMLLEQIEKSKIEASGSNARSRASALVLQGQCLLELSMLEEGSERILAAISALEQAAGDDIDNALRLSARSTLAAAINALGFREPERSDALRHFKRSKEIIEELLEEYPDNPDLKVSQQNFERSPSAWDQLRTPSRISVRQLSPVHSPQRSPSPPPIPVPDYSAYNVPEQSDRSSQTDPPPKPPARVQCSAQTDPPAKPPARVQCSAQTEPEKRADASVQTDPTPAPAGSTTKPMPHGQPAAPVASPGPSSSKGKSTNSVNVYSGPGLQVSLSPTVFMAVVMACIAVFISGFVSGRRGCPPTFPPM